MSKKTATSDWPILSEPPPPPQLRHLPHVSRLKIGAATLIHRQSQAAA
jgi:hypothetical protein